MILNFVPRQIEPDITVIEFSGQLTLGNRLIDAEHEIKGQVQRGVKKLVLDLTGLTFLDSSGVGVLAVCAGAMTKSGGRMLITGASGKVKEVLELTRLDRVIGLYPDLASACTAFA